MVKDGVTQDKPLIPRDFLESILQTQIVEYKTGGGSNPGDNFTSILISIEARLVGEDEPLHLLFKTFPHHPTRQKLLEDTNLFLKEYLMYSTWIRELVSFQADIVGNDQILRPAVPQLIAGQAIDYEKVELNTDADPMLSNFILMIDERKTNGFKMADKTKSLELAHVKIVLDELAKLHALGHAYKVHKKLNSIRSKFPFFDDPFFCNPKQKPMLDAVVKMNIALLQENLQDFLQTRPDLADALNKFAKEGEASDLLNMFLDPEGLDEEKAENLMRKKPEKYSTPPLKDQWIVAGHGDCWTNNMIFKNDADGKVSDAILVDLQIARESCITADITYFLYTSTDTPFRKKHLQEVLTWYFQKFSEYCKFLKAETFPEFTWENFERKFHRSKIFGFLFAVIVQPIILCNPETAVDLDTVEINENEIAKGDELAEMISKSSAGDGEMKILLKERFSTMLIEMQEEGVL